MLPSLLLFFLYFFLPSVARRIFRVEGHVSHGVNSFNNLPIVDFSEASNLFDSYPPLLEIGVFRPGAQNASRIFPDTPLSSVMANIDGADFQNAFGFPRGIGPWNVPLQQVPTIEINSININDRRVPKTFADTRDSFNLGGPYLSAGVDKSITLGDWNRASARIIGLCSHDGTSRVKVQLKNGLPHAVYTMWDIGVSDPLTTKEKLSAGPFGGLPNVMTTKKAGKATLRRKLNYCPFDKCAGSKRCTLYVSLFYHFDHMVYGGSPALDFDGQPIGQVASNQIQIFLNGKPKIQVQNRFKA